MTHLFHYTSVNGIRGIIESGNVWATHLGFLNDLSEENVLEAPLSQQFAHDLKVVIHDQSLDTRIDEVNQGNESIHSFCLREARQLYRNIVAGVDKHNPVFIASFCRHREPHEVKNGLLSQWRGYAGVGGGYCVVFDEEGITRLVEEEQLRRPHAIILKKDIVYVGENKPIDLSPFGGFAAHYLNNLLQSDAPTIQPITREGLELLAFVKSEAFREENETRIMVAAPDATRNVQFRENSDLLIPYVQIFNAPARLPIIGIIVGPGPLARRSAAGVTQFLRAHQLDVEVRVSNIPLVR